MVSPTLGYVDPLASGAFRPRRLFEEQLLCARLVRAFGVSAKSLIERVVALRDGTVHDEGEQGS